MRESRYAVGLLLFLLGLSSSKVLFVAEVARHGIATPKFNASFFPELSWSAFDELTAGGERQLHLLGRLRRYQYIENSGFLPAYYDPSKLFVRTTETKKAMMSAQSYLLGLYPDGLPLFNENQTKHANDLIVPPIELKISGDIIKWLNLQPVPQGIPPIPVYSANQSVDTLLDGGDCPFYYYAIDSYFLSSQYKKLRTEEYAHVWEQLKLKYQTISDEYLGTRSNAYALANYIITADLVGKRPSLITADMVGELKQFVNAVLKQQLALSSLFVKLSITDLTKDLIGYMNDTLAGKPSPSLILYVTQSHTIGSLLYGLKSFNDTISFESVGYAANVLFELSSSEGSDEATNYVSVYYNGELIHKEAYDTFQASFTKAGDLGQFREEACKIRPSVSDSNLRNMVPQQ